MEVSRSGRARKKSAKVLEMEEADVDLVSTSKTKRKSCDVELNIKKSPKAGSPKKNSLSYLLPRVASAIGGAAYDPTMAASIVPQPFTELPLKIDVKVSKSASKKRKRTVEDVLQSDGDMNLPEQSAGATQAAVPPQPVQVPQQLLGAQYSFEEEEIHEEYDTCGEHTEDEEVTHYEQHDVTQRGARGDMPALADVDDYVESSDEYLDFDGWSDSEDDVMEMKMAAAQQLASHREPAIFPKKKIKTPPKKSVPKIAKAKPKSKGKIKEPKTTKSKGKPRTTGYTLWCNEMRKNLMTQYPDSDFAEVSKKLSELWDTVSATDKEALRKKAKKIQRKQNLGEDVVTKPRATSTHLKSGQTQPSVAFKEETIASPVAAPYSSSSDYVYKVTGNEPIDAAAHLKLLGESLGTIGARLQEHKGQIAVQGSLSVLLDSLLCAIGPLFCLTSQVPELNSLPAQTHQETLDSLAYIMPGI